MRTLKILLVITLIFSGSNLTKAEDGYELWLRYMRISSKEQCKTIQELFQTIFIEDYSPSFTVIKEELVRAGNGMTGMVPEFTEKLTKKTTLLIGTPETLEILRSDEMQKKLSKLGEIHVYYTSKPFQDFLFLLKLSMQQGLLKSIRQ